ncbi:unnamed protein product [Darwinula stevensoni]|uniref:Kinesin motor domain-containing protein n=1 Tax=Darwinula stevensoni TaxID=69355 RepID=A0A7R8WZ79_9CRUS|nr:unnamed protein product [Darwinula stevensoni]CAG0879733.1 unnamed protein product [Darwinula stevensoni]
MPGRSLSGRPELQMAMESECTIRVDTSVRIRPLLKAELNEKTCLDVADDSTVQVNSKSFRVTKVFDDSSTQEDVFSWSKYIVQDFVKEKKQGIVLAYGQTGTGKTYTLGTDPQISEKGLIRLAIDELFNLIKEPKNPHPTVKVAFLDIYLEEVRDLLATGNSCRVRESESKVFHVEGLKEIEVFQARDAVELLYKGCRQRSFRATNKNAASSRSHAIFTLIMENPNGERIQLWFVDLAGSEDVGRSEVSSCSKQWKEGVKINNSLSTLRRVIHALHHKSHIPYRDSILTKILYGSLKHSCNIQLIASVSPCSSSVTETLSTLHFAIEMKGIPPIAISFPTHSTRNWERKRKLGEEIPTPVNMVKRTRGPAFTPAVRTPVPFTPLTNTMCTPQTLLLERRWRQNVTVPRAQLSSTMASQAFAEISGLSISSIPEEDDSISSSAHAVPSQLNPNVISPFVARLIPYVRNMVEESMKEPKEMLTNLNSTLRSWMTQTSTAIRPRGPRASESSDSETEPESTILGTVIRQRTRKSAQMMPSPDASPILPHGSKLPLSTLFEVEDVRNKEQLLATYTWKMKTFERSLLQELKLSKTPVFETPPSIHRNASHVLAGRVHKEPSGMSTVRRSQRILGKSICQPLPESITCFPGFNQIQRQLNDNGWIHDEAKGEILGIINNGNIEELKDLPQVGNKRAAQIIELR